MSEIMSHVWGKSPMYGDYIRHGVTSQQMADWQDWFSKFPMADLGKVFSKNSSSNSFQSRSSQADYISWSFVLPPNALSFSKAGFVAGAMVQSHDKVGRYCPLVIFRIVSKDWLLKNLSVNKGLLFWQARLIEFYGAGVNGAAEDDVSKRAMLNEQVSKLDELYTLSYVHRFGIKPFSFRSAEQSASVLLDIKTEHRSLSGLSGVSIMPWINWPICAVNKDYGWFWQQNVEGKYIGMQKVKLSFSLVS
ncbi:type VI secretion system-associated protein TagF [Neisseriaceae bacterium TC5R-5]|nr:type VI secretion system-associated protein TagF [Neisseriaceae bacterium TC5R-5]